MSVMMIVDMIRRCQAFSWIFTEVGSSEFCTEELKIFLTYRNKSSISTIEVLKLHTKIVSFGMVHTIHSTLTIPMSHHRYDKWIVKVLIGLHCLK